MTSPKIGDNIRITIDNGYGKQEYSARVVEVLSQHSVGDIVNGLPDLPGGSVVLNVKKDGSDFRLAGATFARSGLDGRTWRQAGSSAGEYHPGSLIREPFRILHIAK